MGKDLSDFCGTDLVHNESQGGVVGGVFVEPGMLVD